MKDDYAIVKRLKAGEAVPSGSVSADLIRTSSGAVHVSTPSGPQELVHTANINTVLQAAGGAGWEKATVPVANYVITRPTSGAGLDLHIEIGGTLAAMLVANWPIPASGVDQLRIRNFSAIAQTFSATGYSGIVTADGNAATSGTYSIPVDMAVHITIDEDGWIQVAPMGQEVSQAEMDAALLLKMNAVVTVAGATNLNTLVAEGFYQSDLTADATNHPTHINEGTEGVLRWRVRVIRTSPGHCLQVYESTRNTQSPEMFRRYSSNAEVGSPTWSSWIPLDLSLGAANPLVNSTAAPGVALAASHEDHVHPIDTSRAPAASPIFTGTPQVGGNPKLGSNAGHAQRSFSDVTGAAMLMVPATGTATTTTATTDVAARLVKPGTSGTKANAVFDIVVGSHTAGLNGSTQVDFRLANGSTNVPDMTALTIKGDGGVLVSANPTEALGVVTKQYADTLVVGLLDYRGAFTPAVSSGAAGYPTAGGSGAASAVAKGDMFVASAAGFILTEAIQIGDSVIAKIDTPGQTAANWDKLNANITYVPEDQASKVIAFSSPTDTQYPSAKLVSDQLAAKQSSVDKGVANGYASLGADGRVPTAQMPSLATTASTSIAPILGANIGLPGYRRCKLIPINSTTTGTGDYQVEVAIGESALSVGAAFHLAGNSLDFPAAHKDGGEFAFVNPDGTAIPFWVAEVTGTAPNRTARIYLRMSGLTGQATSVQSLVFLLYDNNILTVPQQMAAITGVFNLLADDWDGASLDLAKWTLTGTAPTLTGSILTFDTANTPKVVDSVTTFGDGIEILHRTTFVDDSQSTSRSGFIHATAANDFAFGDVWDQAKSLWVGATRSNIATPPDATSRLYRLSRLAGNGSLKWTATDTVIDATRTGVLTVATPIRAWNAYGSTRGSSDWIAARQILATPPALGAVADV